MKRKYGEKKGEKISDETRRDGKEKRDEDEDKGGGGARKKSNNRRVEGRTGLNRT